MYFAYRYKYNTFISSCYSTIQDNIMETDKEKTAKELIKEVKALVEAKKEWVRKVQSGQINYTKGKRIA